MLELKMKSTAERKYVKKRKQNERGERTEKGIKM